MNRLDMEKTLKKVLDKERFRHTMGVMYTAAGLAMAHGADMDKALCAGLLHDCAKCIPNDRKLQLCIKYNIEVSRAEQKSPFLLHAKLGAYFAEEKYGVTDPEILHAIRVHTTGVPNMGTLDKIIYIADYMEPNRDKAPNLDKVRALAFRNLDETMLVILEDTLAYLKESKEEIDPLTATTYEYFKKCIGHEHEDEEEDELKWL